MVAAMLVEPDQVHYMHPAELVPIAKSEPDRQGRKPVMIRASSEKQDKQGEVVLKSAYADDRRMLDDFLRQGYFDWNHETDLIDGQIYDLVLRKAAFSEIAPLNRQKHEAIIGGPLQVGLRDDFPNELGLREDGLYCKGYLLPTSFHGKQIIENIEAGFTGYGASLSAFGRKQNNVVKSLVLRKIGIQPRLDSANDETWIRFAKSHNIQPLASFQKSELPATPEDRALEILERLYALSDDLRTVQRRQRAEIALLLCIPKVADALAAEIRGAIKLREVALSSDSIRQYLTSLYFFDETQAAELADMILLRYGDGKS